MELPGYCSFLVRLWREAGADGRDRWCGEVEQIQSGQRWPFASMDALIALLYPPTGTENQASAAPPASRDNEP
jgi:hypothetical protein